jgi:hypothetical protein
MEEHPDCQPRRTVTVNRCDDDDGDRNKDFERKRIDDSTPIAFSAAENMLEIILRDSRR